MMPQPIITYTPAFPTKVSPDPEENYAVLLDRYSISYTEVAGHLHIGKPQQIQGWLLHLSVIQIQVPLLLEKVLPVLQAEKTPFKIPTDATQVEYLLSGAAGYHRLGKVVTIYPLSDQQSLVLAQKLIDCTKELKGPAIPTDRHLGACVYTRYGGFKPVYLTNEDGQTQAYIADYKGNIIKDDYFMPFRLPKGIQWPFSELVQPYPPKAGKLLNKRYLPIQTLKNDVKGKVIKALDLKNWFCIRWCIIKQGNQHMSTDAAGRDIRDRLLWQYTVHLELEGRIPLPKVYDYFEIKGDDWLVMEYIEGISLSEQITHLYSGGSWPGLTRGKQLQVIAYLLQVVTLVEQMHRAGYIHRDLSPSNFLVNRDDTLVAIDVELTYYIDRDFPHPIFTLGTPGFMSPEQMRAETPTVKEDVYGLGGLFLKCFTGLSPTKFSTHHPEQLAEHIYYFIHYEPMAQLVSLCLHQDAASRPGLTQIKTMVEQFRDTILHPGVSTPTAVDKVNTASIVQQALRSLSADRFTTKEGIWFSKTKASHNGISNEVKENTIYPGLSEGISGVLYLVATTRMAGYDLPGLTKTIDKNVHYLQDNYLNRMQAVPPGLYNGSYGLAMAIVSLLQAGLLTADQKVIRQMTQCLSLSPGNDLNVATGIAGQGLAILSCLPWLNPQEAHSQLQSCVSRLLSSQEKDGSWKQTKTGIQDKAIRITGLAYGIAGITYFLLLMADRYQHQAAKDSALKALNWLVNQRHRKGNHWIWTINTISKTEDPWLDNGFSGIAWVFIKAHEIFKDNQYKEVAQSALLIHPAQVAGNYLMLSGGIAGLGEIYLEAYRVFKEEHWLKRADWIAGLLTHTVLEQPDGSLYWLADYDTHPTADLMTGNAGIIHFLVSYPHAPLLRVGTKRTIIT